MAETISMDIGIASAGAPSPQPDYNQQATRVRLLAAKSGLDLAWVWGAPMLKAASSALLLLLLFLVALSCMARERGLAFQTVDITIVLEGERQPYLKQVTIRLQDEWGSAVRVETTTRGSAQFLVNPGVYRLTVTGPEIDTYDDEFTVTEGLGVQRTVYVEAKRWLTASRPKQTAEPADTASLQVPRKAEKELQKARKAIEKRDWQRAGALLRNAIGIYPRYDAAYAMLGEMELLTGDGAGGRRDLETAIRLNPNNAEACRKLAEILVAESKYAEAEPLLQASLRQHPADAWALSYAALGELVQGKLQEAVATAQKVHTLPHREYASAHLIAARALEGLHRLSEAAAEYQLYLAEAPKGGNVQRARAALQRLSNVAAAAPHK